MNAKESSKVATDIVIFMNKEYPLPTGDLWEIHLSKVEDSPLYSQAGVLFQLSGDPFQVSLLKTTNSSWKVGFSIVSIVFAPVEGDDYLDWKSGIKDVILRGTEKLHETFNRRYSKVLEIYEFIKVLNKETPT